MGIDARVSHWRPEREVPLRDITLHGLLAERVTSIPERMAAIFDEPEHCEALTYADLGRRSDDLARALIAAGVAAGARVAVMAPNGVEWLLLEHALSKAGAVLVTVNPAFREGELSYLLAQGRVDTLVTAEEHRGFDLGAMVARMVGPLRDGAVASEAFPALRLVVGVGPGEVPGALDFAALMARAGEVSPEALAARAVAVQPKDVAQIQYTSGTTGKPKGAMLTHFGTVNNALIAARLAGYRAGDVMVSAMPFFHTAGCVCNVMGMLAAGGCLVAMRDFDAARQLDLMERHGGTVTNGVPTMYVRLMADPRLAERDLGNWRIAYAGGTSIPPALMMEVRERTGAEPVIIMGMTECSPIITQTRLEEPLETRVSTAGTPLPHVEVRVVDPVSGAVVPVGGEGELQIRGFLVTAGYFDLPERTAEAIDAEGWLRSGDLARMDAAGHVTIIGRIKDMLIRGGENIYPVEIEDALLGHPGIAEAQVVGVPDPEFGEEVFAFVVLRDGHALDAEGLRGWCRQTMARHKLPRYLAFLSETPKTANGKVRKVDLRERARAMVEGGTAL